MKQNRCLLVIYLFILLIFTSQTIRTQGRFHTGEKKLEDVKELDREVTFYLRDYYLLSKQLAEECAFDEWYIANMYYVDMIQTLRDIEHFSTLLEIIKSTQDECYTNELDSILNKELWTLGIKIDGRMETTNLRLEIHTRQSVIQAGNEIMGYLRKFKMILKDL